MCAEEGVDVLVEGAVQRNGVGGEERCEGGVPVMQVEGDVERVADEGFLLLRGGGGGGAGGGMIVQNGERWEVGTVSMRAARGNAELLACRGDFGERDPCGLVRGASKIKGITVGEY